MPYHAKRDAVTRVKPDDVKVKLSFTTQQDMEWNCGPACLREVLLYYGIDVPVGQLEAECGTEESDGTDWEGMEAGAKVHGLTAKLIEPATPTTAVNTIRELLDDRKTCVICINAWGSKHFVVPVGCTGRLDSGIMLVYDPYIEPGRVGRVTVPDLKRRWTGDNTILVLNLKRPLYVAEYVKE